MWEHVRRLGWDEERLGQELEKALSEEAFKRRISHLLVALARKQDPARLLFRPGQGELGREPERVRKTCDGFRLGGGWCCEEHMVEAQRIEARARRKARLAEALAKCRQLRGELESRLDLDRLEKKLEDEVKKAA